MAKYLKSGENLISINVILVQNMNEYIFTIDVIYYTVVPFIQ